MSSSKNKSSHVGLILLSPMDQIEYVDPILLKEVSAELKDWLGLGFTQWMNYTFPSVTLLDSPVPGDNKNQIWRVGANASEPQYLIKRLSSVSSVAIQIERISIPPSLETLELTSTENAAGSISLTDHWKQVMGWIGPGLLHDANNHMTGLLALAECLWENPEIKSLPEKTQIDLRWITQCAEESSAIFQTLTRVYRLGRNKYGYADLRELLDESAKLFEISLPRSVQIDVRHEEVELPVRISSKEFFQLLLGLMAEAFPNGNAIPAGTLSLKSSSGTRSAEKKSCIAGKWMDDAVATIEIQFDCELSKSLPEADELKQVSIGHLSKLLVLNSSFVCLNTENCGWMIAFPIAELD